MKSFSQWPDMYNLCLHNQFSEQKGCASIVIELAAKISSTDWLHCLAPFPLLNFPWSLTSVGKKVGVYIS